MRHRLVPLALLLAPSALAQDYAVEPLDPGGTLATPSVDGLLTDGTSVGWATPPGFTAWRAVRYFNGGYQVFPPLVGEVGSRAYGSSPSGIVCGASVREELDGTTLTLFERAVVWDANLVAIDLQAAATSGDALDLFNAVDANDLGQIVGRGREPQTGISRGFVFDAGVLTAIPSLPGELPSTGTDVKAISPSGVVVGVAQTATGDHAIRWQGGSSVDLHAAGGVLGLTSHAFDVNAAGVVVGSADPAVDPVDAEVACRWVTGQPVEYLGTLGGVASRALGVNNAGDIVGWSWTVPAGFAGFLWRNGTLYDLNDLVDPSWSVVEARKIGEDGTIIAFASQSGGPFVPVKLRPEVGVNYCVATPNSTGFQALIEAEGSASVVANDLTLRAGPVPATPGLFFYGPDAIQAPFGNGLRCVGGPLFRLSPATPSLGGVLVREVDNTALAAGGSFTPGSTWRFQAWYRDPAAGGAGFDLSDGLAVTFAP